MSLYRRLLRLWPVLLIFAFCGLAQLSCRPAQRFTPQPLAGDQLRVVTWNVGYFAPVADKNMKSADVERVTELLERLDAHIIVLQELGSMDQAARIADQLGRDWRALAVPTGHGKQVLAVISNLPVENQTFFECGGRMAVDAAFDTPQGRTIRVVGVHAPHPMRGVSANHQSIRGALERGLMDPGQPCVVAGDMNINFDPDGKNPFYQDITKNFGDSTITLGETYYAYTRIDHVFHSPHSLEVVDEGSGLVDLPPRLAMVPGFRDHRPIVVTYRMQ